MAPRNVTHSYFWEAFVFHVDLLYMYVEPCNYFMQYSEAMHVKYAAPVEAQIVKEQVL